jgi:cyclin B
MSNNVKFINPQEAAPLKNHIQKKVSLNSKNIPGGATKANKSFRGKIDKNKDSKQPLGVNNENDANQGNIKPTNQKNKLTKMKSMDKVNNQNHSRQLSAFTMEKNSKNTKNETKIVNKKVSSLNLENLLINISFNSKNKIETDEYREMFSKYVRDDYSNSIIKSLLEDEQINENYLNNHKITERMRTRMVDWMIEVLSNYHCDESTYFESINLMDRYFKQCEIKHQVLLPAELHLIGVTSMFIASKYQDIYPLRLKIVQDKIAHNKLTCQEIKDKEDEIMRYLNYNIGLPTMWDFITIFMEEIFYINCNHHNIKNKVLLENYYEDELNEEDVKLGNIINKKYTKNMLNLLKYVCIYLGKMNCHDYNLMQKKPSLLAASTIFVAIKICEQINKEEYINDYFTDKLNDISNNNENDIIKTAQKILYNAQNFDSKFSGLDNLKKVHFNAIIELKETK